MTRREAISLLASAPAVTAGLAQGSAGGIDEDFSHGLANWWTEGGERVWVEDGRLHMRADNPGIPGGGVATAWRHTVHPGNFELSVDAHVISSMPHANNINLFFCYTDPSGAPLYETRHSRQDADYAHYHKLSGHIITFLNGGNEARKPDGSSRARIRIRRNPGFQLLAEKFDKECREGVTYRLGVRKLGGEIRFSLDGETLLTATDPHPLGAGLLGLRTYRTYLWWDNIRMSPISG